MSDPRTGWPPEPGDLWLVQEAMGAPVAAVDESGTDRYVILRLAARRNHSPEARATSYVLDLAQTTSVLGGLITLGNVAFGRDAMVQAMAEALDLSPEDRRAAAREAAQRLADDAL